MSLGDIGMSIGNSNGAIKIDPEAARLDCNRIDNALESLRKAKIGLVNVKIKGRDDCEGQTAQALMEKADELLDILNKLVAKLDDTKSEINKTVQQFQTLDEEIASNQNNVWGGISWIRNGRGGRL